MFHREIIDKLKVTFVPIHFAKSSERIANKSNRFRSLSEGIAKVSAGIANPSMGFAKCSAHFAKPSEGFAKCSARIAKPSVRFRKNSIGKEEIWPHENQSASEGKEHGRDILFIFILNYNRNLKII
jgi:hypothetical protein